MAIRRWVVNASPLILLGKAGRLNLLAGLADELVVPQAVLNEVQVRKTGFSIVATLNSSSRFRIAEDILAPQELMVWDLGRGETQVIALALVANYDRIVLDDLEARRCAQAMGLRVIGTLGVIARAKRSGIIEQAYPVIQEVCRAGLYVTDDLVAQILNEIGEPPTSLRGN